ncbi:MAG: WXG100 family type VII secretion target [Bacilli bacterium]|nr:WXG100 family type VII secretion target [Bacilli bacterium]
MGNFSITLEQVAEIAKKLKKHADKMQNILEDVTSKINTVHADVWQSAAATTHLDQYNDLKSKYQSFYDEIIKIAKFLDDIVSGTISTEINIQNALNG